MAFLLSSTPTFGSEFGKGLGAGITGTLSDRLKDFYEEKRRTKEAEKVNSLFRKIGEDAPVGDKIQALLSSSLSPETQKQGLELLKQQGAKQFIEGLRTGKQPDLLDIIEGASLGYIPPGLAQVIAQQEAKPVASAEGLTNLAHWAGYSPEEVKGFTPEQLTKFGQVNRKRIEDFEDKSEEAYKRAVSAENTLEVLRDAIQEGGADPISAANFADYFESIGLESGKKIANALENPSSTRFRSATKDLFQDLTKFFGARPNQYVEKLFYSFLPQIGKSKEANEAALEVLQLMTSELKRPFEISEEIYSQKGFLPHDISREVTRRLGDRENQWDRLQEVLEKYNAKSAKTSVEKTSEKEYPVQHLSSKLAKENPGKILEDEKGRRYKSTGKTWRRI